MTNEGKIAGSRGFERRVKQEFQALGFTISEMPGAPDKGYDFIVESGGPLDYRTAVEVKYYEHSRVAGATVMQFQRNQRFDKFAIVTTLGFTREAHKVASETNGKVVLLTEAELIERMPARTRDRYVNEVRQAPYYRSYLAELVNLQFFEPSFRFYDRIPKERLVEILSNLSTTELLKILEKMVPQEDLLPMLAASLEPAEVIETAVERPVEKETKERKSGIAEKYRQAIVEKDSNRKGKLLEEVMKGIISLVRGLEVVGSNVNDGTKEIDIQVRNRNEENVWETIFDPMVFIECKNWSESVKSKDIRDFEGKLVSGDLNAGILVAVNGISGDGEGAWGVVREALQRGRKIVVLDGVALDEILKCRGVSEVIDKQYIQLYQIGAH